MISLSISISMVLSDPNIYVVIVQIRKKNPEKLKYLIKVTEDVSRPRVF